MTTVGYLASNQVVGSSNLSGRAIIFKHLAPFRKIESSHKNTHIKVVIDGWGAIVGNVVKSGWFAYMRYTHIRAEDLVGALGVVSKRTI